MLKDITLSKTFIVAEAGVNHNGRLDLAKQLVKAVKEVGADAVKFQTWKTDNILVPGAKTAEYQQTNTGDADQYEMVKKLELAYADFAELKKYAEEIGIMFFSTPDDEESLNFLVDKLNVPLIKIGSGELTNLPYLKTIASKKLPMILSTGMGNIAEVKEAVKTIELNQPNPDLAILHCTSNYPCPLEEVNLGVLQTYQEIFPNYVIGYSDHTIGILVPQMAVALGAKIVEKHFTLDNKMEGPDHVASLNPEDLRAMINAIRLVENDFSARQNILNHPDFPLIFGNTEKKPTESEKKIRPVVLKTIVARFDLAAGTIISESEIAYKRTSEAGLAPNQYQKMLGKKLKFPVKKDKIIALKDVE